MEGKHVDISKLIEQYRTIAEYLDKNHPEFPNLCRLYSDTVTALSSLLTENEDLRDKLYDGEGVNLVDYWMQQAQIEERGHRNCRTEIERLQAELKKAQAERDAAVKDLRTSCIENRTECQYCKRNETARSFCYSCRDGSNWEWKGKKS